MSSLIVIIANPAAKNISRPEIEKAAAVLSRKGYEVQTVFTEHEGHAVELAHAAVLRNPFRILAAGGDGTINEVANGMALSGIPLGILPCGTTNVLAKELSIPEDIRKSAEAAVADNPMTVSLGCIEYQQDDTPTSRSFCLMAGIGFDGQAVHEVNRRIKRFSGKGAYIYSGLKILLAYHPNELFFSVDGSETSGYGAIICKASRYGGNFRVTPDARLAEPYLHACIFQGKERKDLLGYALDIIRGTCLRRSDVFYRKASNIEVIGAAHIQIDGDYAGLTPAKLSVRKDALKIAGAIRQ